VNQLPALVLLADEHVDRDPDVVVVVRFDVVGASAVMIGVCE